MCYVHNECHYFPHCCDMWCCLWLLTCFPIFDLSANIAVFRIALKYSYLIQALIFYFFFLIRGNFCTQVHYVNESTENILLSKVFQVSVF